MILAAYHGTRPGLPGLYNRAVRIVGRGPYSHAELVFAERAPHTGAHLTRQVPGRRDNRHQHP